MNKFQKQYIAAINNHKTGYLWDLGRTPFLFVLGGFNFSLMQQTNMPYMPYIFLMLAATGAAAVGCSAWNCINGIKGIKNKKGLKKKIDKINARKDAFPLQHVRDISITDKKGLEGILERTRANESREWATFHKAESENGAANVYSILDSRQAEEEGFIEKRKKHKVTNNISLAHETGFSGNFHFHPTVSGQNYAINPIDRIFGYNQWLNFISFNMPDGPEIISYNRQFVYLPKDKTKAELAKASQEQVLEYLSKY
ncbi:MAG: hypothetical protein V1734_06080 [Nanoarchaeota archaeon]